jgi:hypothetical protein
MRSKTTATETAAAPFEASARAAAGRLIGRHEANKDARERRQRQTSGQAPQT